MPARRFLCLALLSLASVIAAADEDDKPTTILNVTENLLGTQITITGSHFGPKMPTVYLGGEQLTVVNETDTSITANLPPSLPAGA